MDLIANCLANDFMIDHATSYGIQVHTNPTRSDSLVNNLHYKKENIFLKVIHDYLFLPRCLVFTVLCYMELFVRSHLPISQFWMWTLQLTLCSPL